ncbi:hypothetical protein G3I28_13870, partial [Streptomyces sp. SID10116]|nr:hypothetical protein [Streptomyces sp. SID10116]
MAGQEDQDPAASVGLEVSQVVELPRPRTPGGQDTARMYAVLTVTVRRAGAAHAPPAATVR